MTLLRAQTTQPADRTTTPGGVTVIHVRPAEGAKEGDFLLIHYTGKLEDGTQFDSSADREPIEVHLGTGQVIDGWEEGLRGMQVGEKRQLIIPSKMGFGDKEAAGGKIPANATLIFDVELVGLIRR